MLAEKKEDLINCAVLCAENNMVHGTSGNISILCGDKILITRTGSNLGGLELEDIVTIDLDGNLVEGDYKASSEKFLHTAIYKLRDDIKSIIHVHSPALGAFALANKALDKPYMPEIVFDFGEIPIAEYGCPSTQKLVDNTAPLFREHNAVLMANHGFIIGDRTIWEAYMKLEMAENYAQTLLNAQLLGGAKSLTVQQVEEINSLK